MLFIIPSTLNIWNISNQNVFMFLTFSKWWGIECTSSQRVSKKHFSRRSVVTVLARPVFWGMDLCMLSRQRKSRWSLEGFSRGFTSREFASRSPFAIKFANPSDTMSACAPPFSLQGFPIFVGHKSSYCCARNFDIVKLNFFIFLSSRIVTHILTAFSITFLTHLKNDHHSLVCLLKSLLLTICLLTSLRLLQQFTNFFDWMARKQ